MAKAIGRKRANHRKAARAHAHAHHAAKTPARRMSETRASGIGGTSPTGDDPEPEIVDDESTFQRESRRISEDEADDEFGIYGPGRGETAG
ncbi:MAG TPA: hypothetical protein VH309_04285 [Elusimicrobiota bacterium]|jgi:hypothetical protein|nr:hypothetical protein [Elusimicrobiota bacterium]